MTEHRIEPHKVTKPIQLLAAWLVGLVLTNGIFLATATSLETGSWERGALVVSAIINVPLFLAALFLLQTRFRAELQEDTYYSEYLSKKTASVVRVDRNSQQDARIEEVERQIAIFASHRSPVAEVAHRHVELDWTNWRVALNVHHPRFAEVREALRSASIPLAEAFGYSEEAPKKWIISLSQHMPHSYSARLLEVLIPLGFDGFQFWEPQRDAEENEDVYIGSYGADAYAGITSELGDMLSKGMEPIDFSLYLRRHTMKEAAANQEAI